MVLGTEALESLRLVVAAPVLVEAVKKSWIRRLLVGPVAFLLLLLVDCVFVRDELDRSRDVSAQALGSGVGERMSSSFALGRLLVGSGDAIEPVCVCVVVTVVEEADGVVPPEWLLSLMLACLRLGKDLRFCRTGQKKHVRKEEMGMVETCVSVCVYTLTMAEAVVAFAALLLLWSDLEEVFSPLVNLFRVVVVVADVCVVLVGVLVLVLGKIMRAADGLDGTTGVVITLDRVLGDVACPGVTGTGGDSATTRCRCKCDVKSVCCELELLAAEAPPGAALLASKRLMLLE